MAYLNSKERDDLLDDLIKLNFTRARRKIRRMDKEIQLVVYRNVQQTGEWLTQYDMVGRGTRVYLIEDRSDEYESGTPDQRLDLDYELVRVIVEPLPGNRT
jgi:hypothetical protein